MRTLFFRLEIASEHEQQKHVVRRKFDKVSDNQMIVTLSSCVMIVVVSKHRTNNRRIHHI